MNGNHKKLMKALLSKRYREAERLAVERIRERPTDPQGWVALGQALLGRKQGKMAKRMLRRARLLDPAGAWVAPLSAELDACPEGPDRPELLALLRVPRVKITAAVVALEDADLIARCLESLKEAADEIVVMDAGATGETLEVVRRFPGVKAYRTEWKDSFAALRNEALERVGEGWVFWIDADERLHPQDGMSLREAAGLFELAGAPAALGVLQLQRHEGTWRTRVAPSRLFSTRHKFQFRGRLDERAEPADGREAARPDVFIRVLRDEEPADADRAARKEERNLRLLALSAEDEPQRPEPRIRLGDAYMRARRPDEALSAYLAAERLLGDAAGVETELGLHLKIVFALLTLKRLDEAEERCRAFLEKYPDRPEVYWCAAETELARTREALAGSERLVDELVREEAAETPSSGVVTATVHPQIAVLKADLEAHRGRLSEALALFRLLAKKFPDNPYLRKRLKFLERQGELLLNPK